MWKLLWNNANFMQLLCCLSRIYAKLMQILGIILLKIYGYFFI